MNHEHTPWGQPEPRHRAEYPEESVWPQPPRDTPREQVGDTYVQHVIEQAPTPEAGAAIAAVYAQYGTPFAIYLALRNFDQYIHDPADHAEPADQIEADFKNCYHGHYADKEALVEDTIESFGWRADASQLLHKHVQVHQFLVFDRDAIYGFVREHYEVVEIEDGLYVFERPP